MFLLLLLQETQLPLISCPHDFKPDFAPLSSFRNPRPCFEIQFFSLPSSISLANTKKRGKEKTAGFYWTRINLRGKRKKWNWLHLQGANSRWNRFGIYFGIFLGTGLRMKKEEKKYSRSSSVRGKLRPISLARSVLFCIREQRDISSFVFVFPLLPLSLLGPNYVIALLVSSFSTHTNRGNFEVCCSLFSSFANAADSEWMRYYNCVMRNQTFFFF